MVLTGIYFLNLYYSNVIKIDYDKVSPKFHQAKEGGTVSFQCHSDFPVKWIHLNHEKLPDNAILLSNKLVVDNLKLSNKGIYECQAKTKEGHTFYSIGALFIKGMKAARISLLNVTVFRN